MRPGVIYLPAFTPLQIECISRRPNLQPIARFANGMPVESDNRFRIIRPDSQRLVITAPGGLSNVYNGHRIQCVLPGVGDKETTMYIIDRCVSSESQCRSRECVPTSKVCDGRPDCRDRSDEGEDFCNAGVTVSPTRIVVRPGEAFTLQCQSLVRGRMPYARFVYSGRNVEQDPRFRTERPSREQLIIQAPRGLDLSDNNTRIECYFPDEGTRIAIINIVDRPCPPQSFYCMDGSCIPSSGLCDGIRQCPDGSDELGCDLTCHAPNIACRSSGECIDPAKRCDGREDCRDGFDEKGCPPRCPSPKHECRSGECISPGQVCDGRRDCADGSDEFNCPSTCFPPNIQCPSGECISSEQRCDGRRDCQDGFDEQGCRVPCYPPNIYCSSGECIGPHAKCDGQVDCADGSDERDCVAGPSFRPSEPIVRPYGTLEIECVSGKPDVRPQVTLSNGTMVEHLSRFMVSYPSAERIVIQLRDVTEKDRGLVFRCSYPTGETTEARVVIETPCGPADMMCRNGMCIPYHQFCNGIPECPDGSDEQLPHCETTCQMNQYKCASGDCVDISARCDGRRDCYDGSDEAGCPSRPILLPEHPRTRPYGTVEVECRSNKPGVRPELRLLNGTLLELLPRFEVLRPHTEVVIARIRDLTEKDRNMVIQCFYPSGETTQTEIVIDSPCEPSEWMCRDGTCLPQSYFCNGRPDCRDGSDEQPPHCEAPIGCRSDEFRCYSGECIDVRRRCDGRGDCRDGSDEHGCVIIPTIRPERPIVRPYGSVEIECRSNQPHIRPELRVINGTPVEQLSRFQVTRPSNDVVVARIHELTERDRNMVIQCVYPTGEMSQTEIVIDSPCEPSEWMCRDGTCLPQSYFSVVPRCKPYEFQCRSGECVDAERKCDQQQDCYDGSDEEDCGIGPSIRPERPIIRPYGSTEIECRSNQPHIRPEMRVANGTPVEQLPRFEVRRPQPDVVVARITDLTERDRNMVIQCLYPTGETSETEILIDSPCGPSEWMCRDGQCIPQVYFCNNRPDCRDGSDEQPPHCAVTVCQPHEFRCASGECIDARRRCDKQRDCYDGSDEDSCEPRCQSHEFRCNSGECIDARRRCDGQRDCYDGSDEDGCVTRCQPDEFRCTTGECIDSRRRCNGQRDCYDGSDEDGCEIGCRPNEFRCSSGECIDARRRCDRQRDCYDGSDEAGCVYPSQGPIIRPERPIVRPYSHVEFECRSDVPGVRPDVTLINGTALEQLPRFHVTRPSLEVALVRIDNLTESDRDLIIRCSYPTGESSQTLIVIDSPCGPHEVMCRSGSCVPATAVCDGRPDCPDGSDEQPPRCYVIASVEIRPTVIRTSPYEAFKLECISHNRAIQPFAQFSDGRPVESDNRFQLNYVTPNHLEIRALYGLTERDNLTIICMFPGVGSRSAVIEVSRPCPFGEYQCQDGGCLQSGLFCNGRPDCADGSDESERYCGKHTRLFTLYNCLLLSIKLPSVLVTIY
ncbi:Low-density lipoprotein receptor [Fasciola gigantica]|uniref:Low-density lipoprotein receptor n=1 Tax=Fasciola gigantica TaxID=46835 RepID=A0A504YIU4_FASGI|nr:Low-density lipoprotein receptor [Fasciola gigantica]